MRLAVLTWSDGTWITSQLLDLPHFLSKLKNQIPSIVTLNTGKRLVRGRYGNDACPTLAAEPGGRCVAVVGASLDLLYVIPVFEIDSRLSLSSSDLFIVDLMNDFGVTNIKDIVFLNDSFEPNLLILYEPKRTWSGRAAIQRNTAALMNIAIDLKQRKCTKTWTMDSLPYDSYKLVAIPGSADAGALCLSTNVIMQVRHGACTGGLSLNCFGDVYMSEMKGKYDTLVRSNTLVECDAANCAFMDLDDSQSSSAVQSTALLSLKGGELYFLNVVGGGRTELTMKRAGSTVIASQIIPINHRFFVLASRLSDSLLVEYQEIAAGPDEKVVETTTKTKDSHSTMNGTGKSTTRKKKRQKRKRTAEEEAEYEMMYGVKPPNDSSDEEEEEEEALDLEEKVEGTRGEYDDDDELGWVFNSGKETSHSTSSGAAKWGLKVKDTLPGFGPGADMAVGFAPDDITRTKLDMVVAGGYGKNGCLAVIHQTVRPIHRTEFELPGCDAVWAVADLAVAKRERVARQRRNEQLEERNIARRSRNAQNLLAREQFVKDAILQMKKEARDKRLAEEKQNRMDTVEGGEMAQNGGGGEGTGKYGVATNETTDVLKDHMRDKAEKAGNDPPRSDSEQLSANVNTHRENQGTRLTDDKSVSYASVGDANGDTVDVSSTGTSQKKVDEDELMSDIPDSLSEKRQIVSEEKPSNEKDEVVSKEKSDDPENDTDYENESLPEEIMADIKHQSELNYPMEVEEIPEGQINDEEALHSYMLLSTESSTTILKTGVEIEEVTDGSLQLITSERTITASSILKGDAIVQVVASKIIVVRRSKKQCEFSFKQPDLVITRAQISDPLILAQTSDNHVHVLRVEAEKFDEDVTDLEAKEENGEEEEFDEYGMAMSGKANSRALDDAQPKTEMGYRNFTIKEEFSSTTSTENGHPVATAYLYGGSLATDITEEGILDVCKQETTPIDTDLGSQSALKPEAESDPLDSEKAMESETLKKEDDHSDQVEDEDRMLYGDDNDDDEDMLLYGNADSGAPDEKGGTLSSDGDAIKGGTSASPAESALGSAVGTNQAKAVPPEKGVMSLPSHPDVNSDSDHLLLLVSEKGSLQVRSRGLRYAIVLEFPAFYAGSNVVCDCNAAEALAGCPPAAPEFMIENITMIELSGSALVPGLTSSVMVVTSRMGLPLIYQALLSEKSSTGLKPRSHLIFRRVSSRDRTAHLFAKTMKECIPKGSPNEEATKSMKLTRHIPFRNIAGRGGIFVTGKFPFFLFAERGYPRIHPVTHLNMSGQDVSREEYEEGQELLGLTEFHNVKCPRGFVSVSGDGRVRIGELPPPSLMNYDAPTPVRKIALRCTPHKVAYHSGSATYGILASMPTLTTREERLARILQSLEKHDKRHYQHTVAQAEAEAGDEQGSRVPPIFEELHELRVYRPDTWDLIKSHKLQKGEVGLAIANMVVDVYKQKIAGPGVEIHSSRKGDDGNESMFAASLKMRPKNMLVVGTGYLNGEDSACKGRLLLFEISRQEAYSEAGGQYTAFQLRLIAEKNLPSPVTAVAAMEGYVIAGVGPQISVYKLVGEDIIHLSFAFGQLYCTSIATLKQYVVAADLCKSVSFMYYRDRNNSVNFLGKDFEHVTSYATEFLIENENVSIILSDGTSNFQLLSYAHASVPESRGGKRLLMNGGCHFGSRVNKLVRVRSLDSRRSQEKQALCSSCWASLVVVFHIRRWNWRCHCRY